MNNKNNLVYTFMYLMKRFKPSIFNRYTVETIDFEKEMTEMDNKQQERNILVNILNTVKSIFNRQGYIKADTENILRSLNNFNRLNIPCQIESMTPKQLYRAFKGGWTIQQLSGLSGIDELTIKQKIENYAKNNT